MMKTTTKKKKTKSKAIALSHSIMVENFPYLFDRGGHVPFSYNEFITRVWDNSNDIADKLMKMGFKPDTVYEHNAVGFNVLVSNKTNEATNRKYYIVGQFLYSNLQMTPIT